MKTDKIKFEDEFIININELNGSDEDISVLFINYLNRMHQWFSSNKMVDVWYTNQLNESGLISCKDFEYLRFEDVIFRNSIRENFTHTVPFKLNTHKISIEEIRIGVRKYARTSGEYKKEDLGKNLEDYNNYACIELHTLYNFVRSLSKNKKKKLKFHLFLLQRNFGICSIRRFLLFLQGSFDIEYSLRTTARVHNKKDYKKYIDIELFIKNNKGQKIGYRIRINSIIERYDLVTNRKLKINKILREFRVERQVDQALPTPTKTGR